MKGFINLFQNSNPFLKIETKIAEGDSKCII